MRVSFSAEGWEDYTHWFGADRKVMERINVLIAECQRHPFTGTGKPEPLRKDLTGWWSRRIDQEHRLIYRVYGKGADQTLEIAQARFHY